MGGWNGGPSSQNLDMVDRMLEGPVKPLTDQAWRNAVTTGGIVPPRDQSRWVWWEVAVILLGVVLGAGLLAGGFLLGQLLPT